MTQYGLSTWLKFKKCGLLLPSPQNATGGPPAHSCPQQHLPQGASYSSSCCHRLPQWGSLCPRGASSHSCSKFCTKLLTTFLKANWCSCREEMHLKFLLGLNISRSTKNLLCVFRLMVSTLFTISTIKKINLIKKKFQKNTNVTCKRLDLPKM